MENKDLITKFYSSFKKRDFKSMQECYADNATFSDEVFQDLNASQVKSMWEMLCLRGKDLELEFKNVNADEKTGSAEWIATYTFSKSGRKVENRIKVDFIFENGKIAKHSDHFSFYRWSRQALGISGLLLGWTPFLKNKVRKTAMKNLNDFINKK
jgi:ketosteroid isomerase-like protein